MGGKTITDPRALRLIGALRDLQARHGRICIAYSGGLDSRFLAHAARLAALDPLLFHVSGPHVPARETIQAEARAAASGLRLCKVACDPLELPEVRANGKERCYYCKRALFSRLCAEAGRAAALAPGDGNFCLCDGTNLSDRQGYRPGLRALAELGVRSPLAEAGLDKPAIRELAALTGLEQPDQPSRPCLLTRLPYGVRPTAALLDRIDALECAVEETLKELQTRPGQAVPDFRIRLAGTDPEAGCILQLPLPPEEEGRFTARLADRLASLGLPVPALSRDTDVSGYFDRRV